MNKKGSVFLGIVVGLLVLAAITTLAVGLLFSGNLFYRLEINALEIENNSGLSREIILNNYDAVIRFLSPFSVAEFSMPDLPASAAGISHFEDVKIILNGLYITGLICLLILVLIFSYVKAGRTPKTLITASVSVITVPLAAFCVMAIDFNSFFTFFHKVFFSGDTWIFDIYTDPVITILPEAYFMHCALIIAAFWVIGSAALFFIGKKLSVSAKNIHSQEV